MGATLVAVHGFLIVVTSLVMELRLWAMGASGVATPGLWSTHYRVCGVQGYTLCSMWDLPGPRIEPVSPELAGGFFTTEPPGKPWGEGLLCDKQITYMILNIPTTNLTWLLILPPLQIKEIEAERLAFSRTSQLKVAKSRLSTRES